MLAIGTVYHSPRSRGMACDSWQSLSAMPEMLFSLLLRNSHGSRGGRWVSVGERGRACCVQTYIRNSHMIYEIAVAGVQCQGWRKQYFRNILFIISSRAGEAVDNPVGSRYSVVGTQFRLFIVFDIIFRFRSHLISIRRREEMGKKI